MFNKTISLFAVIAMSLSTAAAFEVNTATKYKLTDKNIQNGTHAGAGGIKHTNNSDFSAALTPSAPETKYQSAKFKCENGQTKNGLVCFSNETIEGSTSCRLPTKPPYSAAYCNLYTYNTGGKCHYSRTCQGGGTEFFYGTLTTTCPKDFTVTGTGECQKSIYTSARPFCDSGWKLDGYMCHK